jgi:hypothetical protein
MSKNKIVYLRWGDRYTQDHVDRLYDQVNKNCSIDFDFITMDVSVGQSFEQMQALQEKCYRGCQNPESSITENQQDTYKREDAGGIAHFRKNIMFMRDEEYKDCTFLYLDLDTIIKNDLSYFFDLELKKPMIMRSWQFNENMKWQRLYRLRSCPYFNSSVLLWKTGQNRKVFNELTDDKKIQANFFHYGMNDNWLFHRFGPYAYNRDFKNWFNFFEKNKVISDERYMSESTIIHTLAGLNMSEKNKICLS